MATLPEVRAEGDLGPEPELTIAQPVLHAMPGAAAQTRVTLRHTGPLVESFRFDVVGLPEGWWRVEPPTVELLPRTTGTALVELRPPAGTPEPEAPLPFGVRAVSALDPGRSVVEEGDLGVGRVLALQGEILPLASRARWSGRHVVTYTNWGNSPVDLQVSARDPDDRLAFLLTPDRVTVPVGGTAKVRVKARFRRPVLRGRPQPARFQVTARRPGDPPLLPSGVPAQGGAGDPPPPVLDASVEQKAVLSAAILVGLVLAALLAAALVAWVLRAAPVPGAHEPFTTPPVPKKVRLTEFRGDKAIMSWAADDTSAHDVGLLVDEDGTPSPEGQPTAFTRFPPYTNTAVVPVPGFKADGRSYCFGVVAVQGTLRSPVQVSNCLATKPPPLKAPTGLELEATGPGQAFLKWAPQPGADFVITTTDDQGAPTPTFTKTISKATSTTVPTVVGFNCFAVRAEKGGRRSQLSPPACIPVEPPPVGTTGDGGQPSTGGPGQPSPGTTGGATAGPQDPNDGSTGPAPLTGFVSAVYVAPSAVGDARASRDEAKRVVKVLRDAGYRQADWRLFSKPKYPLTEVASYVAFASNDPDREVVADTCRAVDATIRKNPALKGLDCVVYPLGGGR